jgi:hypothetical protein
MARHGNSFRLLVANSYLESPVSFFRSPLTCEKGRFCDVSLGDAARLTGHVTDEHSLAHVF